MARAQIEDSRSRDGDAPGPSTAGRQQLNDSVARRTGLPAESWNRKRTTARGPVRDAIRQLRRSRNARIGGTMLSFLTIITLAAPWIAPYDPIRMSPNDILQPPGARFPLGTDQFGRDVFSRILLGAPLSLMLGVISVTIAGTVGTLLGLAVGYWGGWTERIVMRCIDVMLAFPGILLALSVVAVLGPGLNNVMIAVGIGGIPTFARIVRGSVLSARENVYVEAARALGAADLAIVARHVLPNVVAPIIVLATLGMGTAILSGAALSYLGLGAQPPAPEWGAMLSTGRDFLRGYWWISTFPGLAILLTVMAINLLGDGLRDALDPRLRI
jgi:peptide/nickel transport system permease protein